MKIYNITESLISFFPSHSHPFLHARGLRTCPRSISQVIHDISQFHRQSDSLFRFPSLSLEWLIFETPAKNLLNFRHFSKAPAIIHSFSLNFVLDLFFFIFRFSRNDEERHDVAELEVFYV